MKVHELLDQFCEYIQYDPEHAPTNLLSSHFAFHNAGKKIEELLSGYDPSGVIAVMYAREIFLKEARNSRIVLYDYFTKQEIQKDLAADTEMYRAFYDPEILEAENGFLDQMNDMVQKTVGKPMIGSRDKEAERAVFAGAALSAVSDLNKCRVDVYRKAGKVGKIEKFTTRILVFERMADCLLHLEQAPDALYFCYINQYGSADGYFSFLIKSNGNILSICDRITENYIGQHRCESRRNSRYAEAHADGIFPYNAIFAYDGFDSRGCATRYMIDDEKLEFMCLEPEVYQPILIAMLLLSNKYADREPDGEPMYLNTLFPENYLKEHPGTDLMVLQSSDLALRHDAYRPEFDLSGILDGSLNEQFGFHNVGNLWVELYGKGFQPDYHALLPASGTEHYPSGQTEPVFYTEFAGTREGMDREAYRRIRIQLAEYIRNRMAEEYDAFGGKAAITQFWTDKMKQEKQKLYCLLCEKEYSAEHPEETHAQDSMPQITRCKEMPLHRTCLNHAWSADQVFDDLTGKKCSIFFQIEFANWKEMEQIAGELPKVFRGWSRNGCLGYNGNSILNATDAVGNICSLLYGGSDGRRIYETYCPDVWIGFSKAGWKKIYENWLVENGHEEDIVRKKEAARKQKEEEKQKLLLPAKPYEPSDFILKHRNTDQAIVAEKELDSIIPGARITGLALSADTITSVSASVTEKGNRDKLADLESLGWTRTGRHCGNGRMYVEITKRV